MWCPVCVPGAMDFVRFFQRGAISASFLCESFFLVCSVARRAAQTRHAHIPVCFFASHFARLLFAFEGEDGEVAEPSGRSSKEERSWAFYVAQWGKSIGFRLGYFFSGVMRDLSTLITVCMSSCSWSPFLVETVRITGATSIKWPKSGGRGGGGVTL